VSDGFKIASGSGRVHKKDKVKDETNS